MKIKIIEQDGVRGSRDKQTKFITSAHGVSLEVRLKNCKNERYFLT